MGNFKSIMYSSLVLRYWSSVIEHCNVLAGRRIIQPKHQPRNSCAQGPERHIILVGTLDRTSTDQELAWPSVMTVPSQSQLQEQTVADKTRSHNSVLNCPVAGMASLNTNKIVAT